MALTFCSCGQIKGRCPCGTEDTRKNTTQRGYGYDWQKLSKAFRSDNPLCWRCLNQGRTTPTEHAHHIQSIKDAPQLRLKRGNLAALCGLCHEIVELELKEGKSFDNRPSSEATQDAT